MLSSPLLNLQDISVLPWASGREYKRTRGQALGPLDDTVFLLLPEILTP